MDIGAQRQDDRLNTLAIAGSWAFLFLVTVFVYWPGLNGPFVLDDFSVLAALGDRGGVTDWETFKTFLLGGSAGPTGRPLALLTFLIDANNWPAESFSFKRTNLFIHVINGALLGVVTSRIMHILQCEKQRARWIVLVSVACWLLHPFLVSTTLYVVQRMSQLAVLFIFAGLAGYLHGRSLIDSNRTKAYVLMSLSTVLCTLLAMISKENGILLPMLIGVIEITVVASQGRRLAALSPYWVLPFIVLPSGVVALYLGMQVFKDDFFNLVPPRDYSAYERLITQPRVLVDYLQHWFIPKLYTTGVFQDHFIKSTSLFSPITSALSVALHIAIIALSIAKRRKWPILACAALFFYVSHILESTVVNLELYFEHRNYLAAAFLFLPLVVTFQNKVSRRLFFGVAACVMLVLAGFTRYSATVWASIPSMVEASARKAPTSARAQVQYALLLFNAEHHDESLRVIDRAIEIIPGDNPLLLVNRVRILCKLGMLDASEYGDFSAVASGLPYDSRMLNAYTSLISDVAQKRCPDIETAGMRQLFDDMLRVPRNAIIGSLEHSHIKYLAGFVDVHSGNAAPAVEAFKASLHSNPGAEIAMTMAGLLATNKFYEEALHLSELALSQIDADVQTQRAGTRATEAEIREFQAIVRAQMQKSRDVDMSRPNP